MADVREVPALFTPALADAIWTRRKTQTRRPVDGHAPQRVSGVGLFLACGWEWMGHQWSTTPPREVLEVAPWHLGDVLWVREAHRISGKAGARVAWVSWKGDPCYTTEQRKLSEPLAKDCSSARWRPSIHMPRWAARSTAEVLEVRLQRVQAITREDALAEGMGVLYPDADPREAFAEVWSTCYPSHPWSADPWVWAYTFRTLEP